MVIGMVSPITSGTQPKWPNKMGSEQSVSGRSVEMKFGDESKVDGGICRSGRYTAHLYYLAVQDSIYSNPVECLLPTQAVKVWASVGSMVISMLFKFLQIHPCKFQKYKFISSGDILQKRSILSMAMLMLTAKQQQNNVPPPPPPNLYSSKYPMKILNDYQSLEVQIGQNFNICHWDSTSLGVIEYKSVNITFMPSCLQVFSYFFFSSAALLIYSASFLSHSWKYKFINIYKSNLCLRFFLHFFKPLQTAGYLVNMTL